MIESFEKRNISRIEEKSETRTGKIFEKSKDEKEPEEKELSPKEIRANKILKLAAEESADLTIRKISKTLGVSFNCVNNDIRTLVKEGLIKTEEINYKGRRTKLIFLPESGGLKKKEEGMPVSNVPIESEKESAPDKKLSAEEEYIVLYYTAAWNLLGRLEKDPELFKGAGITTRQFPLFKKLENLGILKIVANELKEIDWGKFEELRAHAREGKILELINERREGFAVKDISMELKISVPLVQNMIRILAKRGLIETKIFENEKTPDAIEQRTLEKQEDNKNLNPIQNYILNQTMKGRLLKYLEKNPNLASAVKTRRGSTARDIERLLKAGIIEAEGGRLKKIRFENLERLWDKKSRAHRILELLRKSSAELSIREISEIMKISIVSADDHIHRLYDAGLVAGREVKYGRTKTSLFFLPNNVAKEMAKKKLFFSEPKEKKLKPEVMILQSLKEGSSISLKQIMAETSLPYQKILRAVKNLCDFKVIEIDKKLVKKIYPDNLKKFLKEEIKN